MIADKLDQFSKQIPHDVCLVAVSKTKPQELLIEAYESGQRVFGENKVQELVDKHEKLPKDIQWHFIGHLQRNKVKYLAPFVDLIHSVESLRLLKEVNKQGLKNNRVINVLLQFHIANEDSKFGLSMEECSALLESKEYLEMQNVKIRGVMGMATFTKDQEQVRSEFKSLKKIYDDLKSSSLSSEDGFSVISMGMSGDYEIAIEEGSNMIRIGSTIFGARN